MVGMTWTRVWVLVVLLSAWRADVQAQFFDGFYNDKCPNAEAIVTQAVTNAFVNDPTVPAGLLRLLFHDCFVEGCDGSVLIDPSPSNPTPEKTAVPNQTLRGFEVIDAAKSELERICPQTVSCADIIALAARDGVVLTSQGKINSFPMPTGRLDGLTSDATVAANNLVSTRSTAQELTQIFLNKGLGQDEMITLSGAHTIGRSHCSEISERLYGFPSATGLDPSLDPAYGAQLRAQCPQNAGPNAVVSLDPTSPNLFDNMYYTNGVTGKVLFPSDVTLFADQETQFTSNLNSQNGDFWAQVKFTNALVHMASLEIKEGDMGQVRTNCRAVN